MHPLYELLTGYGLADVGFRRRLDEWTDEQVADFLQQTELVIKSTMVAESNAYSFLANGALSGSAQPCERSKCRIRRIDSAARFALLYADHVAVQDPIHSLSKAKDVTPRLRERIKETIPVLQYARPAVEAGCLRFAVESLPFCQEHQHSLEAQSRDRLEAATALLYEHFASTTTVRMERSNVRFPHIHVQFDGPEDLIEHGTSHVRIWKPSPNMQELLGKSKERSFTREEALKNRLHYPLVEPLLHDLRLQDVYSRVGYRYLTDRDLDAAFIQESSDAASRESCQTLLDGLSHAVPVLSGVDLETLAKLRSSEGEAFKVYRNAIDNVVSELSTSEALDVADLRTALRDTVLPELDRINVVIRNNRSKLFKEITQDVLLGVGTLAIGVGSGMLNFTPGTVAGGLGTLKYGRDIVDKCRQLLSVSDSVRENSFFYVWKASQSQAR